MRISLALSALLFVGLSAPCLAQSLPDQAGPLLGQSSSTQAQEEITNPSGFGRAPADKALDRRTTQSTTKPRCEQLWDLRLNPRASRSSVRRDCIR